MVLRPVTPRPEASLCVQAQRTGMSEGFAHDQRHEGAHPPPAEGLAPFPPGQAAPDSSEQASGPPSHHADAFLPVPTEKAPASPPKKASVFPLDDADGSPAFPQKQACGPPSDKADASPSDRADASSEKASVRAPPLENADAHPAPPHVHSSFSPASSPPPHKHAKSTRPKESPPTKSVDPTTSTPDKSSATTDTQPAPELKGKLSGLTKTDTLSCGEEEDDSWRLPARRSRSSSLLSSSTELTSTIERRAAASGDAQTEGEAAADHSGLQPAGMEAEAAADESPVQPAQKVSKTAACNNPLQTTKDAFQAGTGNSPQQPTQEIAAAADAASLQTAQKLPSSASPAFSTGSVIGLKHSTHAAAATSTAVGIGKSDSLHEAAQAAADSSVLSAFKPRQQFVRTLIRPRPLPVLALHSSSASGDSLRKPPADTSSTEVDKASDGSSATEAPRCGSLQKPSHPTEFRGMKRTVFKKAPPSQQHTASWQLAAAYHPSYLPPHMRPSALSSPPSPTSVLPWGSFSMDMLPAKGPSMEMYSKGPGTTGPAAHRALSLPTVTSSHQGKPCPYSS